MTSVTPATLAACSSPAVEAGAQALHVAVAAELLATPALNDLRRQAVCGRRRVRVRGCRTLRQQVSSVAWRQALGQVRLLHNSQQMLVAKRGQDRYNIAACSVVQACRQHCLH